MNFGKITALNELLVFFLMTIYKEHCSTCAFFLEDFSLSDQHTIKHLLIFKIYLKNCKYIMSLILML